MVSSSCKSSPIYDLLGLGFGPANIAVAGAITESWSEVRSGLLFISTGSIDDGHRQPNFPIKNVLFIEKHHVFRWHPGMLLPGAKMQIRLVVHVVRVQASLTEHHL